MIKKYPLPEADGNLPGILAEIADGATVHLTTEDGSSAAVMMSLAEYLDLTLQNGWRPAPSAPLDMDEIIARFQEAFKIDGCNLDGWLDGIREETNGRGV